MKKSPDEAATTHPAMLEGLLKVLAGLGVKPMIAESPGGPYTAARLKGIYRACGIDAAAEKYGAALNYGTSAERTDFDGKFIKSFNIYDCSNLTQLFQEIFCQFFKNLYTFLSTSFLSIFFP